MKKLSATLKRRQIRRDIKQQGTANAIPAARKNAILRNRNGRALTRLQENLRRSAKNAEQEDRSGCYGC
jgi:hypothetical protein